MPVTCFWVEPSGLVEVSLRRFSDTRCPLPHGYHDAKVILATKVPLVVFTDLDAARSRGDGTYFEMRAGYGVPCYTTPRYDHPGWPDRCECGYAFTEADRRQFFCQMLYGSEQNDLWPMSELPEGAMWDAWWYSRKGGDGKSLMVKTPGGWSWHIDGRASNCALPDDKSHFCWVRHGLPPEITVDKDGPTCAAGAGSIHAGDYHGFLREGAFT